MPVTKATTESVNESVLTFLKISNVERSLGQLTLRGYDIRELAQKASFEEVAYLLWHGKLPTLSALDELKGHLSQDRNLQPEIIDALRVISKEATGMDALRMGAAALSIGYEYEYTRDLDVVERHAARLQAQMPAVVAHSWRLSQGLEIVEPKPEHGLAQGFLYMLEGKEPSQARIDALNSFFVTIAEHGLNASTFALRIIIATNSDMVSALTGAIGAMKGPRHGGAPEPIHAMFEEIGTPANAEKYIRAQVSANQRVPGFGHNIYSVRDPRAVALDEAAGRMALATGDSRLLDFTEDLEKIAVRLLNELRPGEDNYANVELYSALILGAANVPYEISTSSFAIGRTAGWTAHMIDQLEEDRLIRPSSLYIGEHGRQWVPISERE